MNLVTGLPEELDILCDNYGYEMTDPEKDEVYPLVPELLSMCRDVNADKMIDFNDMVWLPNALNLSVYQNDLLLVDEWQDLNRCQQELAMKAGRRLICCGDSRQAIYGFAGADSKGIERIATTLNATTRGCNHLMLTVTRRCGKAIVEEAKKYVPDFEAHESNPEGEVSYLRYPIQKKRNGEQYELPIEQTYIPSVQDGDMILCRGNAPLVSQCLKLINLGKKATIIGRDVADNLINLIKKLVPEKQQSGRESVPTLITKLDEWRTSENEKENANEYPSQSKLTIIQDKYDCIKSFTEGSETVERIVQRIQEVFTDNDEAVGIRLSSIHKAKGLEAERVFFLDLYGGVKRKRGEKPRPAWEQEQEMNLRYVAITRAIKELIYVS
jgi:superfamily I DNA/RNA helicase